LNGADVGKVFPFEIPKSPFLERYGSECTDISPQKVRKLCLYNSFPEHHQLCTEYLGEELIPAWLIEEIKILDRPNMVLSGDHKVGYYRESNGLVEESFVWCPVKFKENMGDTYSIFYTMVNKMDYLERLIKRIDNSPIALVKSLRGMQDRYQVLTLHMEMKNQYDNFNLMRRPNDDMLSPLEMFLPGESMIFDMRELPDLYMQIVYCEYWGDHLDTPYKDPEINKLIELLSKALPYPCKGRSFTSILPNSWVEDSKKKKRSYPEIFRIIIRLIMCSLLGCYEHCNVVANFNVRRKLYKWFYLNLPEDEIRTWISTNKYLVIYIMREYLFFCIQGIPSLHRVMKANYYWTSMLENTFQSMDEVRNHVNSMVDRYHTSHCTIDEITGESVWEQYMKTRASMDMVYSADAMESFVVTTTTTEKVVTPSGKTEHVQQQHTFGNEQWVPGAPWFDQMNKMLSSANKSNLSRCHRPIEMNFLDKLEAMIRRINDEHYQSSGKKNSNKRGNNNNKKKVVDPEEYLTKEIKDCILGMIEWYDMRKHGPNPYTWMMEVPVSVSNESIMQLEHAELLYVKETSRSDIDTVLKNIHDENIRDFKLLSFYFTNLKKKKSIICYENAVPLQMVQGQVATNHALYATPFGQPLSESAGIYYICTSCGKFKTSVHPYNTKQTKEKKNSLCSEGICIDMMEGTFTCAKISSKNNPKKRNSTNDVITDLIDTSAVMDQVKEIRKAAKLKRKNDMLHECPHTKLKRINLIGRLVRTDKGLVIACPECATITTLSRYNYIDSGSVFSCGCFKWDETEEEKKAALPKCSVCSKHIVGDPVYRLVYDDYEKYQIRYMPFCGDHRFNEITKWEEFLELSQIKTAIRNGLFSIGLSDGERVFVEPRTKVMHANHTDNNDEQNGGSDDAGGGFKRKKRMKSISMIRAENEIII
jgi:hypothetical protein